MYNQNRMNGFPHFSALLNRRPHAWATVLGSEAYPTVQGTVRFYQTVYGAVVVTEIKGLPHAENPCMAPIYAMHIHGGGRCAGTPADPFAEAGTHYNPDGCPHPYHAGDLPPLFSANGYALSVCLTDRFTVEEIIERVVIIHASPDDFTTQPAGNAGVKMACGVILG